MKTNKRFLSSTIFGVLVATLAVGCSTKDDRDVSMYRFSAPTPKNGSGDDGKTSTTREVPTIDQQKAELEKKAAEKAAAEKAAADKLAQSGKSDNSVSSEQKTAQAGADTKPAATSNSTTSTTTTTKAEDKQSQTGDAMAVTTKDDGAATDASQAKASDKVETPPSMKSCAETQNTPEKVAARKQAALKQRADDDAAEAQKILADRAENEKNRLAGIEAKKTADASKVTKAKDSDEIKNKPSMKLSFKNLKGLIEISDTNSVVFKSKVVDGVEAEKTLEAGNEAHFCRIEGAYLFHPDDYLELAAGSDKFLINKENDIYDTRLEFKNSNGTLTFICNHASRGFYIQDFAENFMSYINLVAATTVVDGKKFVNATTEDRFLNAIQIQDVEKMKKIILVDGNEGFAMNNGEVKSADLLANQIAAGKEQMACMVADKAGDFDTKKVYFRVENGIAADTPKEIPTATVYSIFRADEKNYFTLSCIVQKSTPGSEIFKVAKNILKFGALERNEYNKQYQKMIDLHEGLKPKVADDDSEYMVSEEDCEATK